MAFKATPFVKNKRPAISSSSAPRTGSGLKAFADDDEEEEVVSMKDRMEELRKQKAQEARKEVEKALTLDPSIFDFDGAITSRDTIDRTPKKKLEIIPGRGGLVIPKNAEKAKTTPRVQPPQDSKYINVLMEKAKEKKVESERVREKIIRKEIEMEKETYGDKPAYVTSSYKKHLEEREIEEQKRRQKDLNEEKSSQSNMHGFFANLLDTHSSLPGSTSSTSSTPSSSSSSSAPCSSSSSTSSSSLRPDQAAQQTESHPQETVQEVEVEEDKKEIEEIDVAIKKLATPVIKAQKREPEISVEELELKYRAEREAKLEAARLRRQTRERKTRKCADASDETFVPSVQ